MNWIAVEDRLPPHGEEILTWSYDEQLQMAILMDHHWYRTEEGMVMTREVYVPCGMGCCGDWKTEDVELVWQPTHWCKIVWPVIE
jgi:hypothetical protein